MSTPIKSWETHAPIQTITPSINGFAVQSNATRPSSSAMSKFSPTAMTNRNDREREVPDSDNPQNGCFR